MYVCMHAECDALRPRIHALTARVDDVTTGLDQHADVLEEVDGKARAKTPRHLHDALAERISEIERFLEANDASDGSDDADWLDRLEDLRRRADDAAQWMRKIYSMILGTISTSRSSGGHTRA